MILMMVILSSVPFGIGTTFCKHRRESWTLTLISLFPHQWGSFCRLMGLGHHVSHHAMYRRFPGRDSIAFSGRGGCLLLVIYAGTGWMGPNHLVDRWVAVGGGQCDCHFDRQFRVRPGVSAGRGDLVLILLAQRN